MKHLVTCVALVSAVCVSAQAQTPAPPTQATPAAASPTAAPPAAAPAAQPAAPAAQPAAAPTAEPAPAPAAQSAAAPPPPSFEASAVPAPAPAATVQPDPKQASNVPPGAQPITDARRDAGSISIGLQWSLGVGVGPTADFVNDFSFRGLAVEGRYWLSEAWTVGLLLSWQVLEEKERGTYERENVAITSTQLRWTDMLPMLVTGHYYLDVGNDRVLPFAGIGLGTAWTRRELSTAYTDLVEDGWHFAFMPELGVTFPRGSGGFMISTRFFYAVESDASAEAWFSFNVGILGF